MDSTDGNRTLGSSVITRGGHVACPLPLFLRDAGAGVLRGGSRGKVGTASCSLTARGDRFVIEELEKPSSCDEKESKLISSLTSIFWPLGLIRAVPCLFVELLPWLLGSSGTWLGIKGNIGSERLDVIIFECDEVHLDCDCGPSKHEIYRMYVMVDHQVLLDRGQPSPSRFPMMDGTAATKQNKARSSFFFLLWLVCLAPHRDYHPLAVANNA